MSIRDVNVVLVHGAWADGSMWSKVIGPLAADGFNVVAPSLPLTSFHDDVAALDRALDRLSGPIVLAGYAYGGAVISAARGDNVQALAYFAGLAPDEGETVADVFGRSAPHPSAPAVAPDKNGYLYVPNTAFAGAFAQNATAAETAVLTAVQRPPMLACITAVVPRPLWKDRSSWFLVAEQDRMISPDNQRFMAERMKAHVRPHPVDHMPMITAPDTVLAVLREAITDRNQ